MHNRIAIETLISNSTAVEMTAKALAEALQRERELSRERLAFSPSEFTAAALAILAGRFATDMLSDDLPGQLMHVPDYGMALQVTFGNTTHTQLKSITGLAAIRNY